MTKAQALAILSDVVDYYTVNTSSDNEDYIDEASEALKTIGQDWHATLCPLCDTRLEHREHEGTHGYFCPECPFIGFEYFNDNDIINLKSMIK